MVKREEFVEMGGWVAEASSELQALWIRHLRWFYDYYNEEYVRRQLRPPVLRLSSARQPLGQWDPNTCCITISEHHILAHTWESVLDTLRHEMAHQYVHEVMGCVTAPAHGEEFVHACRILRCDPSCCASSGQLPSLKTSDSERDKILLRVRELLALAGSPNEHEAAGAMRMAQRYLVKYNLSFAEVDDDRSYRIHYLGRCSARVQEYEYTLAHLLQEHFFVLVLWTFSYDPRANRRGRTLQISGAPQNVEVADYVYHYVMDMAASLWKERRRLPQPERGTKLQYLAGVLSGLHEKLDRQKQRLTKEYGLVWRGDAQLEEFYRRVNPRISTVSGSGVERGSGYYDGVRDGREITIHRPLGDRAVERGRALPGGD